MCADENNALLTLEERRGGKNPKTRDLKHVNNNSCKLHSQNINIRECFIWHKVGVR